MALPETFVHLPGYEGQSSRTLLRKGDFEKNYLLFITAFNLGRDLKIIEERIIQNFKDGVSIDRTFDLTMEIAGRNKSILGIGKLLDAFSQIDLAKYEARAIEILAMQLFWANFDKRRKFRTEYQIYRKFIKGQVNDLKVEDFQAAGISRTFLRSVALAHTRRLANDMFAVSRLKTALGNTVVEEIREVLQSVNEDFV